MERAELKDDQETLKAIAALLLGLAVLAERLCFVPLPLRVLVLSILRPAEIVARSFAVEQAGGALSLPAVPDTDGDSRADALHLAHCFRVLACFFCALHALATAQRPFRGGHVGRLKCASTTGWRSHASEARRVVVSRAARRVDTS